MIEIMTLSNGKRIFIEGNGFTRDEAQEIIIELTRIWGDDFQKQELKDKALGLERDC